MSKSDVVCAIIERETGQKVTPETRLQAITRDSLEFVDLLIQLGTEAGDGTPIPFEKAADLETVGDLVRELA